MTFFEIARDISYLGIIPFSITATAACTTLFLTRRHERRKLLREALDKMVTEQWLIDLEALNIDPARLFFERRDQAAQILVQINRLAYGTTSSDWTAACCYRTHGAIKNLLLASIDLVRCARNSTLPLPRIWNGNRRRSLSPIYRAFSVKI